MTYCGTLQSTLLFYDPYDCKICLTIQAVLINNLRRSVGHPTVQFLFVRDDSPVPVIGPLRKKEI